MKTAPYGSWESPISPRSLASGSQLFEMKVDGQYVYVVEVRHEEEGRYLILKIPSSGSGKPTEINPSPLNARSRVHEYGGGGFVPTEGAVYFSNFADQRLYKQEAKKKDSAESPPPSPVTAEGADTRYADGVIDNSRGRLICVREHHPAPGKRDAVNSIVSIDIKATEARETTGAVLVSGNDFYSFPRLSSDGSKIAWVTWNFPNMPFDGSELWVGELDRDGRVSRKTKVGGGLDESITQPVWSPSSEDLYFVSDRTGWWNLYRWRGEGNTRAICPMDADFAHPDWYLGLSTYAFASEDLIVCAYAEAGIWHLGILNSESLEFETVESPFTNIQHVGASKSGYAVFLGGSPREPLSAHRYDVKSGVFRKIYEPLGEPVDPSFVSMPEITQFPTSNNATAYAFYYAPRNPNYSAPSGDLPPLVVMAHGGPTSATTSDMKGGTLFWTSRGFAVLDVNYGGSSGHGRQYRRRLNGQWGVVDVDDCVNGAMFIATQAKADRNRMVIRGGSAGGYTTLAVLAFRDLFRAGAALYGIGDLELWQLEAHKFEADYCHSLIGAYPEERELFLDRSPLRHAENVRAPLLLLHGLEDKVVPPNQSQLFMDELRRRNRLVAYFPFEGEQHNFRRAKNIEKNFAAELSFFATVLGIETADALEPVITSS